MVCDCTFCENLRKYGHLNTAPRSVESSSFFGATAKTDVGTKVSAGGIVFGRRPKPHGRRNLGTEIPRGFSGTTELRGIRRPQQAVAKVQLMTFVQM